MVKQLVKMKQTLAAERRAMIEEWLEKMKQTLAVEGLPAVSKACDFKGQLERVECPA